jgi:hypothetical protein
VEFQPVLSFFLQDSKNGGAMGAVDFSMQIRIELVIMIHGFPVHHLQQHPASRSVFCVKGKRGTILCRKAERHWILYLDTNRQRLCSSTCFEDTLEAVFG